MPEDARATGALIGPNAILQLLPHLEARFGADGIRDMLDLAGVEKIPDGTAMIPEEEAARLHRIVRLRAPGAATELAVLAGTATADYILAHRIPGVAQAILKALPAPLAARALTAAIRKHAWTFAGSGRFAAVGPWVFEIHDNPLIRGETSDAPLCAWHAAVFERLFRVLAASDCRCVETCCGAQPGHDLCRFEITRGRPAGTMACGALPKSGFLRPTASGRTGNPPTAAQDPTGAGQAGLPDRRAPSAGRAP